VIFLFILTILGIAALRVATLEERMAGNTRDRSLAFQAAEAALRDAEFDIRGLKMDGSPGTRPTPIEGATGADAVCTNGLCCNPSGLVCAEPATPVYQNSALSLQAAPSVQYGTYTLGNNNPNYCSSVSPPPVGCIQGVSRQPRYLIEPFVWDSKNYYRITARGYGLNAATQVTLQEVFKE